MNGATWFGLSAAVNVLSVVLYVLAVLERKRIERIRRRYRLDAREPIVDRRSGAVFGNQPAGGPRW